VTEPFTAFGLGPEQAEELDRSARPSLDEVLAVRDRQAAGIEAWLDRVTPQQLARTAPVPDDDRWPPYAKGESVRRCFGVVLNEEWAHHGFCVRDLDKLVTTAPGG
jgi:DinB superfamily